MAYDEHRDTKPTKRFGIASAVATAIVGIVAIGIGRTAFSVGKEHFDRQSVTADSIEKSMETDQQFAEMFAPYKSFFPSQYHQMSAGVATMIRNGASENEVYDYAFNSTRRFVRDHSNEIAAASNDTLAQIATKNAAVAAALARESKVACSAFGFGGLSPDTTKELSDGTTLLLASAMPLSVKAAHEGSTAPVKRSPEISPEDARAVIQGVRRQGLSATEADTLFGEHAERADVSSRCRMTVALYGAVASMPQPAAARLTSYFATLSASPR